MEAPATETAATPRTLAPFGPARDADLAINRAGTAVRNAQANGAVLYATTDLQRAKDGLMMARSWQQQSNWRAARQASKIVFARGRMPTPRGAHSGFVPDRRAAIKSAL